MEENLFKCGNYDETIKKYNEEWTCNEISLNQLKTFAITEGGVISFISKYRTFGP